MATNYNIIKSNAYGPYISSEEIDVDSRTSKEIIAIQMMNCNDIQIPLVVDDWKHREIKIRCSSINICSDESLSILTVHYFYTFYKDSN